MHTLESLHAELSAQLDKYEQAGVDTAEVNAVRNWHARVATMVSENVMDVNADVFANMPDLTHVKPQPGEHSKFTIVDLFLMCLTEECGEVVQENMKSLRFGLDDVDPKNQLTNEEKLYKECHDLMGTIKVIEPYIGGIDPVRVQAKVDKVLAMLHYTRKRGRLLDGQ